MDFDAARRVGDEGERRVSEQLRSLASKFGFQFRDKVLLKRGKITAECDHVLFDRYGILIIETKVRNAPIRGTSTDKTWTAVYPGKNKPFQNPLLQNMQHQSIVRQVLGDAGLSLSPDQVKRAVVFVDADISKLELEAVDSHRVVDVADLESLLSDRESFPPNAGTLTPEDVARVVMLVDQPNQTGQADVEAAHAVYRGGSVPASSAGAGPPAPAPQATTSQAARDVIRNYVAQPAEPSRGGYPAYFNWKPWLYLGVGVLGVVIVVLVVMAIVRGISRIPPIGWLILLVIVGVGLQAATPERGRGRRRRSRSGSNSQSEMSLGSRLTGVGLALLLAAGLYWFFAYGGADWAIRSAVTAMVPKTATAPAAVPVPVAPVGVAVANQRLKESNPTVYSAASNRDSPLVKPNTDGSASFTWSYLKKVNSSTVKAVTYTLTLDSAGRVIGVTSTE